MLRKGYTTPYAADAGDPVRLVGQVAAVLSIGAGVIHISAAGDHTNLPVMFAGFLAVATLQIGLGTLLLWRRPSIPLILAGLTLMVASIGIWVLSRTQGLPFLEDGHTESIGFKDGVTVLFEAASVPALLLLLSRDLARVSLPSARLPGQTLTALGVTTFALMIPALLLEGGGHHSHEQAVELGIHEDSHHDDGDELAHADSDSHDRENEGSHHPSGREKDSSPAHGHDLNGTGHGHSGLQLASAPLSGDHGHGDDPSPDDGPKHHSDEDKKGGHRDGDHRRGRPERGDGHGDHEEKEPGEGSGGEGPVSISYEPEPSVCVTGICLP